MLLKKDVLSTSFFNIKGIMELYLFVLNLNLNFNLNLAKLCFAFSIRKVPEAIYLHFRCRLWGIV